MANGAVTSYALTDRRPVLQRNHETTPMEEQDRPVTLEPDVPAAPRCAGNSYTFVVLAPSGALR